MEMEMTTKPMSDEEIVENLKTMVFGVKAFERFSAKERETLDMAIKALEQEPFVNKPCVSSGVCEHDKQKALDKIRGEIEKIYEREGSSFDCLNALNELKEFIDKCEAEVEPQKEVEFHCGFEESGFHAYNCNDCLNKCEEWYQWDKEMKK